jgi:hypothetical protein
MASEQPNRPVLYDGLSARIIVQRYQRMHRGTFCVVGLPSL